MKIHYATLTIKIKVEEAKINTEPALSNEFDDFLVRLEEWLRSKERTTPFDLELEEE